MGNWRWWIGMLEAFGTRADTESGTLLEVKVGMGEVLSTIQSHPLTGSLGSDSLFRTRQVNRRLTLRNGRRA